jgi:hypothetical protein
MEARDRITLGIALALIVVAAMSREFLWTTVPLTLFAIFLVVWGREGRRTEAFVGRLPGGKYALKALEQLDMVISPRDKEYEHHIQIIIEGYGHDLRNSLRELWRIRNSSRILADHLSRFTADGLIEYPKNGPGWIKTDIRRAVGRVLDKLGA